MLRFYVYFGSKNGHKLAFNCRESAFLLTSDDVLTGSIINDNRRAVISKTYGMDCLEFLHTVSYIIPHNPSKKY